MATKAKKLVCIIMLLVGATTGCKKDGNGSITPAEQDAVYNRKKMLTIYADQVMGNNRKTVQQMLTSLQIVTDKFLTTPGLTNQMLVKNIFAITYVRFAYMAFDGLGPSAQTGLNDFMNTYPADTAAIEQNITAGNYDLSIKSTYAQQGLPTLDYLLFAPQAIEKMSPERKKYIQYLISRMQTLVTAVQNNWQTSYRAAFISNTQNSISGLLNQFVRQLTLLQHTDIIGANSEGYYAGLSYQLVVERLYNLKNNYIAGDFGSSLAEYMSALKQTKINDKVFKQFDTTLKAVIALNKQPDQLDAARAEIGKLATLFRSGVAGALKVTVSY